MYVSIYNTYINPAQTVNKQTPSASPVKEQNGSFKEYLANQALQATIPPKSFPVDYINKESTFYNKLRMQQDVTPDKEITKSLEESSYVSNFNILEERSEAYTQPKSRYTSLKKHNLILAPKLADTTYQVQKSAVANIYLSNDSYNSQAS